MINRIRKVFVDTGFRDFAYFCREHLSRKSSRAVHDFLKEVTWNGRPEDDKNREKLNSIIVGGDWACEDNPDEIIVRGASNFCIVVNKKTGEGEFAVRKDEE